MRKASQKLAIFLVAMIALIFPFATTVSATGGSLGGTPPSGAGENLICKIFPFIGQITFTKSLCGGTESAADTIAPWVSFVLSLVFIGIILLAVVSIIRAAITYIRSEGDEGKVQEAQKSIKSVFIGIGALVVGLVGLAIVITVIGASTALNPDAAPSDDVNNFLEELGN